MVDYKYYLNKDNFKIGHYGDKHVKRINIALFCSACALVLWIIFFFLMYTFTNYASLDNLEDDNEEYNSGEDVKFSQFEIAAKIMPSYNFEGNAIWMEKTRDEDESIIPSAGGVMHSLDLTNNYFKITDTKGFFPRFKFNKENVPVGNSILMCISLVWTDENRGRNAKLAKLVQGFPTCSEAEQGVLIWNVDDPTTGIDVPVWTQQDYDIDCTDEEDCQYTCDGYNAIFVNGKRGKKCYTYQILSKICLIVDYDPVQNVLSYKGGCFEGGAHYIMEDPVINEKYWFESVQFEVRNSDDPVIKAGEYSNYSYSFGASIVRFF